MDAGTIPNSDYLAQYYLTKDGSRIVLQTGAFGCAGGSKRAIVVNGTGGAWVGCWNDDGNKITIIWEDADTLVIPKSAIETDHEPATPTMPSVPRPGEISS